VKGPKDPAEYRKRANSLVTATVEHGKPCMFQANGRVDVRKLQDMQGKGSGGSESQQDESREGSTGMYITR